ncbi:MAG: hypothetical protein HY257_03145 [Chloroflexi bacterium]|nr:hypothetical protein [Chloroflexota bacterium]
MSLIAFHKFLITAAILFCAGFALRQWSDYRASGEGLALLMTVAFGIAAGGLGIYLKHLSAVLKIPTEDSESSNKLSSLSRNLLRGPESQTRAESSNPFVTLWGNEDNTLRRWVSSLTTPQVSTSKKNGHNEQDSDQEGE